MFKAKAKLISQVITAKEVNKNEQLKWRNPLRLLTFLRVPHTNHSPRRRPSVPPPLPLPNCSPRRPGMVHSNIQRSAYATTNLRRLVPFRRGMRTPLPTPLLCLCRLRVMARSDPSRRRWFLPLGVFGVWQPYDDDVGSDIGNDWNRCGYNSVGEGGIVWVLFAVFTLSGLVGVHRREESKCVRRCWNRCSEE